MEVVEDDDQRLLDGGALDVAGHGVEQPEAGARVVGRLARRVAGAELGHQPAEFGRVVARCRRRAPRCHPAQDLGPEPEGGGAR